MNKLEFLRQLQNKLSGLPQDDLQERLAFYREMIDDRMEEGLSEEEAVSQIGSINEIAAQIITDTSLRQNLKPRKRLSTRVIVLLAVGAVVWLPLLLCGFAVGISLYAALWSAVIALWAGFASAVACVLGVAGGGAVLIWAGNVLSGVALIGAGILCSGLSIFLFFGCKAATKGAAWLTKQSALGIKRVMKKEAKS